MLERFRVLHDATYRMIISRVSRIGIVRHRFATMLFVALHLVGHLCLATAENHFTTMAQHSAPSSAPPLVSSSAFDSLSTLSSPHTSYMPSPLAAALISSPSFTSMAATTLHFDPTISPPPSTTHATFSSGPLLFTSSTFLNISSLFPLTGTTSAHANTATVTFASTASAAVVVVKETSISAFGNETDDRTTDNLSLFDSFDASFYLTVNRNIIVAIILGAIMVSTIVGNIMVIWAIFNYRPLHNVQNMFLVSLAVADIAVAVLVMPFNVAYSLLDKWIFGLHLCEMWLTSDVLCCTASILNLCAIALDRYWAIHDPINYAQKRTMRRVCTSIGIVWILSAIISIPPLIGWNDWPEEFNDETPCKLSEEKSYLIYSSSGSFYIPLLIMTVVYFKIFKATKRRLKDRAKASAMANLKPSGKNAITMTTGSTHCHNHNITKSSSNEDSSSSGSPKASHSFIHIKSRCVRCCGTTSTKNESGRKRPLSKNSKNNRFRRKNKNASIKEARIEIESASDEIDHSRNDLSSSDAFGLTSGAMIVPPSDLDVIDVSVQPSTDVHNEKSIAGNGVTSDMTLETTVAATSTATNALLGYTGTMQTTHAQTSISATNFSSPSVSFVNHPTEHSSAPINNDCVDSTNGHSVPFFDSHLNGAVVVGAPVCSSTVVNVNQSAYVIDKGSLPESIIGENDSQLCSALAAIVITEKRTFVDNASNVNDALYLQSQQHQFDERQIISGVNMPIVKRFVESPINESGNHSVNDTNPTNAATTSTTIVCTTATTNVLTPMCSIAFEDSVTTTPSIEKMIETSSKRQQQQQQRFHQSLFSHSSSSRKNVQLPATSPTTSGAITNSAPVSVKKIWEEKQKISLSRERRATRILGIVMGVFVACWLPFFLMYVIMPFCDSCYLSREMENFITWLGYINSALNPLIYCGFNRDFRRAFQRILSCKKI